MANHRPLGWGVIGATSAVARLAILPALRDSPTARLVSVASLSSDLGAEGRFGAPRSHRRYEEVLEDPDVEAVYVPLPNSMHAEWVGRAAAAGKHILCEKPLGRTAAEAAAMVEEARSAGVVLVEAYMTPFHPRTRLMQEVVRSGRLGDLRFGRCAFTGILGRPDDHRWRPEMGGGCLLDVGIYCTAPLVAAAGGPPLRVAGAAEWTPGGVDSSFSGWLDFGGGFSAAIECSFEVPERQQVELVGTEACLTMERTFTPGRADTSLRLLHRSGSVEELRTDGADPYLLMVEHFAAVVRGDVEQPDWSLDRTVEVAGVLDRLLAAARTPEPQISAESAESAESAKGA